MFRDGKFNNEAGEKLNRPVFLALLNGAAQTQASEGAVCVMDVKDGSILSLAHLKEGTGKPGQLTFTVSRVTDSDFIHIETEDVRSYVEDYRITEIPFEAIVPAVSYLVYIQCGNQPESYIEWEDEKIPIKEAFVKGQYEILTSALMKFFPNGIPELLGYLGKLGLLAIYEDRLPADIGEFKQSKFYVLYTADWFSQIATDLVILDSLSPNDDSAPSPVQALRDILCQCGKDGFAKEASISGYPFCGYTYVTAQDSDRNRQILLLGYTPADAPMYSIMVWLKRHEQIDDPVRGDWQELGVYAAEIGKKVIEIVTSEL